MYQITEDEFYSLCDKIDEVDRSALPYDYIPSIKELEVLNIKDHLDIHLPYLIYLSNDPFKTKESAELASYIKVLLNENLEIV